MIGRRQPPVASPVSPGALGGAAWSALLGGVGASRAVASALRMRFGAPQIVLTDSGTSALVMALRLTAGEGGTVAFPGFACVDLAAAARYAQVRVRLYDLDPRTMSPDLESVQAVLRRGVRAIVVAHLFGFPADVPAVHTLAREHGVSVIEDAAQAAGGLLAGRPLGALGALAVLSFGRGKGISGGHGGALLGFDPRFDDLLGREARRLGRPARGVRALAVAGAQWALGRPALYGIPAAVPALRLGEMVYHPAHEPRALPVAAASLVGRALAAAPAELAQRRRTAGTLAAAVREGGDITAVALLPEASSGYLRFPVRDAGGRSERPELGILRSYPRTLHEQEELRPVLAAGEPPTPGAEALRRTLFTLPTHRWVRRDDLERMIDWLRVPTARLGVLGGLGSGHGARRSA